MLIFKIFKLGPLRDQQKNKLVSKVFIDLVKVKYPACVLLKVKKYFKCILVVGLHFYECMYRDQNITFVFMNSHNLMTNIDLHPFSFSSSLGFLELWSLFLLTSRKNDSHFWFIMRRDPSLQIIWLLFVIS
jgi:hypothetical protein